ncbi:MAG: T9SS type A sorting domain-containing protein [Bacteroidetes bacterium]|nr:T9SS type A sorting domain-containing protein [Bacteroidota bacterium]
MVQLHQLKKLLLKNKFLRKYKRVGNSDPFFLYLSNSKLKTTMKKNYFLLLFGVGLYGVVFSQMTPAIYSPKDKYASFETKIKQTKPTFPKGVVIWSNDFSNGNDWTYDNTSVPFLDWTITNNADTIPVTTLSPAVFTSVNNGFAFIDSDAQGTNGTQNANMTFTGMIDCSSYSNVSIVFEQSYRTYLDTRIIRISNDGGTNWTDFVVTDGSEPTAQNSPNPDVYSINISSVAGGNDSVKVQINYQGNWGWYWAIDDMKIIETDEYDLKLQKTLFGTDGPFGARLQYYQIPNNQVAPINFGGILKNIGVQDISDAGFTADITGTYNGVAGPINLLAETTDTVWCSNTFTPNSTNSNYSIAVAATTSSTEADVTNNSLSNISISVNDYIYARDNGQILGGISNSGQGYEVGHIYDIFQSATLYGIDAVLNSASEPGSEIFVKLYSIDPATGDFIFEDESAPGIVTPADLGQKISLPLSNPVLLNANEAYLAMVGSYGDGGTTNDLVTASSGSATPQTTFYYDYTDQTWYYTTSNVMVRMNFDPSLANIDEAQDLSFSIYPNPTKDVINVVSTFSEGNLSIIDMAGKLLIKQNITSTMNSIDASELMDGVYYLTMSNGVKTTTKKLVIQK